MSGDDGFRLGRRALLVGGGLWAAARGMGQGAGRAGNTKPDERGRFELEASDLLAKLQAYPHAGAAGILSRKGVTITRRTTDWPATNKPVHDPPEEVMKTDQDYDAADTVSLDGLQCHVTREETYYLDASRYQTHLARSLLRPFATFARMSDQIDAYHPRTFYLGQAARELLCGPWACGKLHSGVYWYAGFVKEQMHWRISWLEFAGHSTHLWRDSQP